MKFYKIEPVRKKAVVEFEYWRRGSQEEGFQFATKELGWRWGEFTIRVPETSEEIDAWIANRPEGWGTREEVDDMLSQGISVFLPEKDDDYIELDSYDYEMDSTWDGCWEEWEVGGKVEDEYALIEEIEEGYAEEYEEYMVENGWDNYDYTIEIHCEVTMVEIDDPYAVNVETE